MKVARKSDLREVSADRQNIRQHAYPLKRTLAPMPKTQRNTRMRHMYADSHNMKDHAYALRTTQAPMPNTHDSSDYIAQVHEHEITANTNT